MSKEDVDVHVDVDVKTSKTCLESSSFDRDRLNFPDALVSTWSNHNGLTRSYLDRICVWSVDNSNSSAALASRL